MKPQVLIRTDGNLTIGLGHLTRCIALAHMLKDNFEIFFFYKVAPKNILADLSKNGFKYTLINVESEFIRFAKKDTIIVLDGYNFNTQYQKKIKKKGSKLVCIDDLHNNEFFADLIINHAAGITPSDYHAQPYTNYALGLDYALLRPAFLKQAKKVRIIEKVETIMTCFGGSDNNNLTVKILSTLTGFKQYKKIIIITGSAYKNTQMLGQLCSKDRRIDHRHNLDETKMVEAMIESDVAIVPASGILFEALACGCIAISGTYINNQRFVYESLKKAGIIIDGVDFNPIAIRKAVKKALKTHGTRQNILDGNSNRRVLFKFYESIVDLRGVLYSDKELLFYWTNDPEVRNNSINKKPILWEDHSRWFDEKMNSSDSRIYILELFGNALGQVRFDKKDKSWLINYSVDSKYRGLGLGKIILSKSCSLFQNTVMEAYVNQMNIASTRVFEYLNFVKSRTNIINSEVYDIYTKEV